MIKTRKLMKVPYCRQCTLYTCGPASLRMVFRFFGMRVNERVLSKMAKTTRHEGTPHKNLIEAARASGLYCYELENASIYQLMHFLHKELPIIVNYVEPSNEDGHYAVIIGYTKNGVVLNDPWNGERFKLSYNQFIRRWYGFRKNNKVKRWMLVMSNKKLVNGKFYSPRN